MAHRLGRIAAGLAPFAVGDRRRKRQRPRRGFGIDHHVDLAGQHRNPLADAPASWAPPFLNRLHPLAMRRGNHQDCDPCVHSETFPCLSLLGAGRQRCRRVDAKRCRRSAPRGCEWIREPACRRRSGRTAGPLRLLRFCLSSAIAVISPALPNHGLPGLVSGCSRATTSSGLMRVEFERGRRASSPRRDRAAAGRRRPRSRDISRRQASGRAAGSRAPRGSAAPRRGSASLPFAANSSSRSGAAAKLPSPMSVIDLRQILAVRGGLLLLAVLPIKIAADRREQQDQRRRSAIRHRSSRNPAPGRGADFRRLRGRRFRHCQGEAPN